MKHMIKKTMLTGALSCFLLGTALADDATNQPAKPYWQDIQVVAVNKEDSPLLFHELWRPCHSSIFPI